MVEVVYCPVCGTNIRSRKTCPGCGYEPARDYELYPTLSSIPARPMSVSAKRTAREKQRIQETMEELLKPIQSDWMQQIEQAKRDAAQAQKEIDQTKQAAIQAQKETEQIKKKIEELEKKLAHHVPSSESLITIKDNTYTFGSYPQDADGTERPILWRVLEVDRQKGKALLLSDKILDCKPYYSEYMKTNWEKAGIDDEGLRYWLNHEFYNKAFSAEEKKSILTTTVEPHLNPNPKNREDQGKAVQDKIFLLSAEEVIQHFAETKPKVSGAFANLGGLQAVAQGTEYVKNNTRLSVKKNGNSRWWLRSVGREGSYASGVNNGGDVLLDGSRVSDGNVGVRPALWVNLES